MLDSLNPHTIANDIRMRRSQFSGSFLVVEGQTDITFFKNLNLSDDCQIILAHNKNMALKVIDILDNDNFSGVIAVVDADYWHLENIKPNSPNVLLTDSHDIETMILQSESLEKNLRVYGSSQKLQNIQVVRSTMLEASIILGYIRWISLLEELNFKFEGLTFSKFLDKEKLTIDLDRLLEILISRSGSTSSSSDIKYAIDNHKNNDHDPWQVCCGHDLVNVLAIGLRKLWGNTNPQDSTADKLEKSLRLGYEKTFFEETLLFQQIVRWQETTGYVLFEMVEQ
jgi:hypothetical protein